MVLNRRRCLDVADTYRVLEAGGTLLAQQVGSHNDVEFNEALGVPAIADIRVPSSMGNLREDLARTGFTDIVVRRLGSSADT